MTDYEPRSAWRARPPNGGPGSLVVLDVEGCGVHWPGTTAGPIRGFDRVASALRGWQNYHMDVKGWSDIAYQIAVDQEGRAWTLRGWRTRSGANGNADLNGRFGAILLILTPGEQPTAAMKTTVRAVLGDFQRIYPRGTRIVPHSAIRPDGTDCPGDQARAAISRGDFTPTSRPPEDDLMSDAQYNALNAKLDHLVDLQVSNTNIDLQQTTIERAIQALLDRWREETGVQWTAEIGRDASERADLGTHLAAIHSKLDAVAAAVAELKEPSQ